MSKRILCTKCGNWSTKERRYIEWEMPVPWSRRLYTEHLGVLCPSCSAAFEEADGCAMTRRQILRWLGKREHS